MCTTDREALVALFHSTDGACWDQNRKWDTDAELSQWYGVKVNDQDRVVELSLSNNNLQGTIPEELGALISLASLVLNRNKLTGPIPTKLGALGELKELDLSLNRLSGRIPGELGALAKLEKFLLHHNNLTGEIPAPLGHLRNVQLLCLDNNKLHGAIPKELGALSLLEKLWLNNNKLVGAVPEELGKLFSLTTLDLSFNQLSEIPPEVLELIRWGLREPSWERNPWSRPPSTVLSSGFESALGWWEDVKRYGEGKSNKLKMVLVGLAEAGKTTIVRHFTGGAVPKHSDRTVGIEITPDWRPLGDNLSDDNSDNNPLQVSVWDFAGQADYYTSHQLFLTKGALFLLVVDLHAFSQEVRSGVDNYTDPRGRIYWWLEMLHMRVPGAALAIVGSHTDLMESADVVRVGALLHTAVSTYIKDMAEKASRWQSTRSIDTESATRKDVNNREDVSQVVSLGDSFLRRSGSSKFSAKPLVLHNHVFKVSIVPDSVDELRRWIVKAASGQECPREFNFPAVDQTLSKAWINAYKAMDALREKSPCVLWGDAVDRFRQVMEGTVWGDVVDQFRKVMEGADTGAVEADKVLLRAMQHREAEGGVLLSLANASAPVATDMLHLDPAWLIELVRRLADHNLVSDDEKKQGTLEQQLRNFAKRQNLKARPLFEMHRLFCKSGRLNKAYLRFLWMHRKIDPPGPPVDLTDPEFESIVSTMERLLVMYRSRGPENLVVPARLPEYGPESVMSPENIGEVVVKVQCSFGRIYPPPGIVGRFLAWLTQHIDAYGECWLHGAFFSYTYDRRQYEVFLYESEVEEHHDDGTVSMFAGLTLGVKGSPPLASKVLAELTDSLDQLVSDSAYGYPGLAALLYFRPEERINPRLLTDLRALLDNREDLCKVVDRLGVAASSVEMATASLEETARKLGGVAKQLVEQELLAASAKRKESPYPRLVILVPDADECGAQERIQRVGWDRWRKAWESLHLPDASLHHKFRLRFLCEHNLGEVPCGPDGRGYPVENLKEWVKQCVHLMKASLWILRMAVGTVSNVDLPLNEVLGAMVQATGAELLEGVGTKPPSAVNDGPGPVPSTAATG